MDDGRPKILLQFLSRNPDEPILWTQEGRIYTQCAPLQLPPLYLLLHLPLLLLLHLSHEAEELYSITVIYVHINVQH